MRDGLMLSLLAGVLCSVAAAAPVPVLQWQPLGEPGCGG
jgi:hypothetical protein